MLKNTMYSFEEITDVYRGFPLKEDFLQIGLAALKKDCKEDIAQVPVLKDGKICFTMAVTYYFDDDDLLDIAWNAGFDVDTPEEAKKVVPEDAEIVYGVNVTIAVNEENGKLLVGDVNGEYCVLDHERKPMDWEVELTFIDEEYAFAMVETFLDAAVDAG